jgi:hypothetical protein
MLLSYGLLQGLIGVYYDVVEKVLLSIGCPGDFRVFLSTARGYGPVA